MLLDHINAILFDFRYPWMLYVGRLAFPLFAFLLAYNLEVRQVPFSRYWPRLLVFALLSQPIYQWATGNDALNIFFTLLASTALHTAWKELTRRGLERYRPLLLLPVLVAATLVDFGLMGVLMVRVWANVLQKPSRLNWAVWAIVILGLNYYLPPSWMALLSLPLIALVRTLEGDSFRARWFFYLFYPAHLLVLAGLRNHI
jgi:hypothetical protein